MLSTSINTSPDSRAVIATSDFNNGNTIGIFVCKASDDGTVEETFPAYAAKHLNIRALMQQVGWLFNYEGMSAQTSQLIINRDEDNPHYARIYAYSPWLASMSNPKEISFTLKNSFENQEDIMWAEQNSRNTNYFNPGYDITANRVEDQEETIKLNFRHALSCLNLKIKTKTDNQANVTLTKVKISRVENGPLMFSSATMNAIDGSLTMGVSTESWIISGDTGYGGVQIGAETDVPILLIPVSNAKGSNSEGKAYRVDIYFNGSAEPHASFDITTAMLKHKDEEVYGFQQGKRYTFTITVDDFTHIDRAVIDDWQSGDEINIKV